MSSVMELRSAAQRQKQTPPSESTNCCYSTRALFEKASGSMWKPSMEAITGYSQADYGISSNLWLGSVSECCTGAWDCWKVSISLLCNSLIHSWYSHSAFHIRVWLSLRIFIFFIFCISVASSTPSHTHTHTAVKGNKAACVIRIKTSSVCVLHCSV